MQRENNQQVGNNTFGLLNAYKEGTSPVDTVSIQEEIKHSFLSPSDLGKLGGKADAKQIESVVVDNENTKYFLDNLCHNIVTNAPPPREKRGVIAQGGAEVLAGLGKLAQVGQQGAAVGSYVAKGLKTSIAGLTILGVSGAAAVSWPAVVGFAAGAVVLNTISAKMALNRELQQLIIMVKGQLERIFNIYSTIEEIAQENHLELNT